MPDNLGDRMKSYESKFSTRLTNHAPLIVRLDGKAFHTFTKGLERPFSRPFAVCMHAAARAVMDESGADLAYTQSDEITLVFMPKGAESQMYFAGKQQKLTSVLASIASVEFNAALQEHLPQKAHMRPVFDARAFTVPNEQEAINCVLWRLRDCQKNAVQMAARSVYSRRQLHGVNQTQQLNMLRAKGIEFTGYPLHFQQGQFFFRKEVTRRLEAHEIARLPERHEARTNPAFTVTRKQIVPFDWGVDREEIAAMLGVTDA